MSRNVDKANSILSRYQESQAEDSTGYKDYSRFKRPKNVNKIQSLKESMEWRKQVLKDIKQKINRTFDLTLNEDQIIEINDLITDLINELNKWNYHIHKHLNGPDFNQKRKQVDTLGGKVINNKRYFGRAIEFQQKKIIKEGSDVDKPVDPTLQKKYIDFNLLSKQGINDSIYYGHLDKTDMYSREQLYEFEKIRTALLQERFQDDVNSQSFRNVNSDSNVDMIPTPEQIPSLADVEQYLVERRKKKLLESLNL